MIDFECFDAEVKVDKYSLGGLGGLIRRQKGAVAIRIDFKGILMLFISCHLSGNLDISHACMLRSHLQNPNNIYVHIYDIYYI